ncbi:MAG: flagellar hook capping FlgD N-terminal domain-containing protein [bacterium]
MVLEGVSGTGQQTQQQQSAQEAASSGGLTGGIGDKIGKDQFLKILMAQLKNQNPLKPQKSGQFVKQMSSLTSLEQMTKIANSFKDIQQSSQSQQFLTLLGDKVKATTKQGNTISGEVESVKLTGNETSVVIGGNDVGTDTIASISTMSEDGS